MKLAGLPTTPTSVALLACLALGSLADPAQAWGGKTPQQQPLAAAVQVLGSDGPLHPQHEAQSLALLDRFPLIDTHVDLASTVRVISRRPLDAIPELGVAFPGHFDLPRAKTGKVGGVFLTANAPCPAAIGQDPGADFKGITESVAHVLESMDLIKAFARRYPEDMVLARTADDIRQAFKEKKMATLIGLEGTHQLGNSLSVMRMFAELGVSYVTLTHVCHTAFASSNGGGAGTTGASIPPVHPGNGLTNIGRSLIGELNRLGVMIDLSHTSDNTAIQSIELSKAPVIWSHSGARAVHNHARNVPDDVLALIGDGPGQNRGVVMSVLFSVFIDPNNATIARVADHVEHIAAICGKAHVGLGSDFDGIHTSVMGMEDTTKWPRMIQEFIHRGWTDAEIGGLMGGNLLRAMDEVAAVQRALANETESAAIYEKRTDLPAHDWGGPNLAYLAQDVKHIVHTQRLRDEL